MTRGDCYLCGEPYTKRGMSRHLRACLPDAPGESTLHLLIAGARRSDYWIHLAVKANATLATVDSFLRELWLECCGHMSAFEIGDVTYETPYSDDDPSIVPDAARRSMDAPIGTVVDSAGGEFAYAYDFGSTTELEVRVVNAGGWTVESLAARKDGVAATEPEASREYEGITLLARNRPPEVDCGSCGDPATKVCQTCLHERGPDAWLCEACASAHEDDCVRPAYLPYVNSPRTGVCGYTG